MSSITERQRADGTTGFKADVVVRINGKRVKRSATFDRASTAKAWAGRVEKEIREQGAGAIARKVAAPTVAEVVGKYVETQLGHMGDTKAQVLRFVADGRASISRIPVGEIHSSDIRAFAEELASGGRGPATVSSYLTHLCHALTRAESAWGPAYEVDHGQLIRGKKSAHETHLAGKANVRDRRPTIREIDMLLEYFIRRCSDPRAVPMHLVILFAIFGLRRQGEIVRLRWEDIDGEKILVRKMKHPRKPGGENKITTLTEEAQRIIAIHGRRDTDRVFPYSGGVVSRLFTDACKVLSIENLHFHDLRHEGVSWLLEKGWTTSHAMMVSGHSMTQTLDRYSQLRQRGDKYAEWPWWNRLEKMRSV